MTPYLPFSAVLSAELEAVTRRRQRLGLKIEKTSAGSRNTHHASPTQTDVCTFPYISCNAYISCNGSTMCLPALFFCSPLQLSCPGTHFQLNSVLFAKQVRDLKDTLGICISAGGLRSVAFSLGALREFSKAGSGSYATKTSRSATLNASVAANTLQKTCTLTHF